jgi:hypothetical protein
MNRKELGKLIAALRKENFDAEGNRLTQATLAERAQRLDPQCPLNELIIGKIERGERANLDEHLLLSLANALELTAGERREFFLAASGFDNRQIYDASQAPDDILAAASQMLADIRLPALLLDTYLDVIAVNDILLRLYETTAGELAQRIRQPAGFNLLGYIFSPDFERQRAGMSQQGWNGFAAGNVIYFRRVTLLYRTTDYFAALFAQLRRNREFRWFWEQVFYEEKRYFVGGESLGMGTEDSGRFRYLTTPMVTLTPYGNLEIITHVPRNPETADAFHRLADGAPSTAHRLSPWPGKNSALVSA